LDDEHDHAWAGEHDHHDMFAGNPRRGRRR
jgi:hypothetical protein